MLLGRQERGEPAKVLDDFVEPCSIGTCYWEAFHELTDQRDLGFGGIGAIRIDAISLWLDENSIFDPVERDRYFFHLRELDREYRTLVSKQQEAASKTQGATGSQRKVG